MRAIVFRGALLAVAFLATAAVGYCAAALLATGGAAKSGSSVATYRAGSHGTRGLPAEFWCLMPESVDSRWVDVANLRADDPALFDRPGGKRIGQGLTMIWSFKPRRNELELLVSERSLSMQVIGNAVRNALENESAFDGWDYYFPSNRVEWVNGRTWVMFRGY